MSDFLAGGGQFRGASPTPLGAGLSQVLGLQGGALPGLASEPGLAVPVVVVGDSSDQLSRELSPRRFVSGALHVFGAPNVLRVQVRARQLIVLEFAWFGPRDAAAPLLSGVGISVNRAGTVFNPVGFTPEAAVAIGGDVPGGNFGDAVVATQVGAPLGTGSIQVPVGALQGPCSMLIPPGGSIGFQTIDAGVDTGWSLRWREVPQ